MTETNEPDYQELFQKLTEAIADWEASPYYLPKDELFDLERFLADHSAVSLRTEMEKTFGTPLNKTFWSSSLAYQKLKRARQEVKAQEALQEEKRRAFLEAMEEGRRTWQKWLDDWRLAQRKQRFKVLPGGKQDNERKPL
jgi:hypothetical protein